MGLMHWKTRNKNPIGTILGGLFLTALGILIDFVFIREMIKENNVIIYILFILLVLFFSILLILSGIGIVSMGIELLKEKRKKDN